MTLLFSLRVSVCLMINHTQEGGAFCFDLSDKKDMELVIEGFTDFVTKRSDIRFITFGLKEQLHILTGLADISFCDRFADIEIADYLINPLLKDYAPDADRKLAAYAAVKAYPDRMEKLGKMGMLELFETIEMPLIFCLYEMEKWGMLVKPEALKEYGEGLSVQIEELEESIHKEAGEDFNINSPKQLGDILFDRMKIPGGKKNKTGYSTSAEVLEKLAPDYPFVADILKYRGLAKLKSTYVDGLYPCIGEDNRIHSTFHQTITATGRLSSSQPAEHTCPYGTGQAYKEDICPGRGLYVRGCGLFADRTSDHGAYVG